MSIGETWVELERSVHCLDGLLHCRRLDCSAYRPPCDGVCENAPGECVGGIKLYRLCCVAVRSFGCVYHARGKNMSSLEINEMRFGIYRISPCELAFLDGRELNLYFTRDFFRELALKSKNI